MSRSRFPRARTIVRAALRRPTLRRSGTVAAHLATVVLLVSAPTAALADPGTPVHLAANSLPVVIANLQKWIMGILWSLAGLFAVIGAVYRTTAAGDTEQVTKGNAALKNAAVGAGLGVLAPVLLEIVKGIVGG
jgi:hypothetical protein